MKAIAAWFEFWTRAALFMAVLTLSFKHMLGDRKTAKAAAAKTRERTS